MFLVLGTWTPEGVLKPGVLAPVRTARPPSRGRAAARAAAALPFSGAVLSVPERATGGEGGSAANAAAGAPRGRRPCLSACPASGPAGKEGGSGTGRLGFAANCQHTREAAMARPASGILGAVLAAAWFTPERKFVVLWLLLVSVSFHGPGRLGVPRGWSRASRPGAHALQAAPGVPHSFSCARNRLLFWPAAAWQDVVCSKQVSQPDG